MPKLKLHFSGSVLVYLKVWDTGGYDVKFGQDTDFEIFVESERKISSESNGVLCFFMTLDVLNIYFSIL